MVALQTKHEAYDQIFRIRVQQISDLTDIAAMILTIMLLRAITMMQEEKWKQLQAAKAAKAASTPPAPPPDTVSLTPPTGLAVPGPQHREKSPQ